MAMQARELAIERGSYPRTGRRDSLWTFVRSNPPVPVFVSRTRTPDLELTIEAAARFEALANQPHDPSATRENLDRAIKSLRRRRARTDTD